MDFHPCVYIYTGLSLLVPSSCSFQLRVSTPVSERPNSSDHGRLTKDGPAGNHAMGP